MAFLSSYDLICRIFPNSNRIWIRFGLSHSTVEDSRKTSKPLPQSLSALDPRELKFAFQLLQSRSQRHSQVLDVVYDIELFSAQALGIEFSPLIIHKLRSLPHLPIPTNNNSNAISSSSPGTIPSPLPTPVHSIASSIEISSAVSQSQSTQAQHQPSLASSLLTIAPLASQSTAIQPATVPPFFDPTAILRIAEKLKHMFYVTRANGFISPTFKKSAILQLIKVPKSEFAVAHFQQLRDFPLETTTLRNLARYVRQIGIVAIKLILNFREYILYWKCTGQKFTASHLDFLEYLYQVWRTSGFNYSR